MRQPKRLTTIDTLPWELRAAPHLRYKPLNRDPASGARTGLLQSMPRMGIEHKAQYHLSEEEFFCLEGRFTFDGQTWFRPGSYVCYPADVVHGAHVSVPEGYLVYLRTSGSSEVHRVPDPLDDRAYPRAAGAGPILLERPRETRLDARGGSQRELRRNPVDGSRIFVLDLAAESAIPLAGGAYAMPLELFLIRGSLLADGERITAPAYGFVLDAAELGAWRTCDRSELLVHSGGWP